MTNQQLQWYIEQGLQTLSVFAYADIEPVEMDMHINRTINKLIDKVFLPKDRQTLDPKELQLVFDQFQFTQDDFRILKKKDTTLLSLNSFSRGMFASLPSDYYHLINDRSVVQLSCYVNGVNTTVTKEVPNRLSKTEDIFTLLANPFETTHEDSPLSELEGSLLRVYTEGKFTVNSIIIDYVKAPRTVDTTTNPAQSLEFPEHMAYRIAEYVTLYLAKITEQPQQKIVNLEKEL